MVVEESDERSDHKVKFKPTKAFAALVEKNKSVRGRSCLQRPDGAPFTVDDWVQLADNLQKQKVDWLEYNELKQKNPKAAQQHPLHGKDEEAIEFPIKDFGLTKCQWVTLLQKEKEEQQQNKKKDYLSAVKNAQRLLPPKQQKLISKDRYYQVLEQNQKRWEERQIAVREPQADQEDSEVEIIERNPADMMF